MRSHSMFQTEDSLLIAQHADNIMHMQIRTAVRQRDWLSHPDDTNGLKAFDNTPQSRGLTPLLHAVVVCIAGYLEYTVHRNRYNSHSPVLIYVYILYHSVVEFFILIGQ